LITRGEREREREREREKREREREREREYNAASVRKCIVVSKLIFRKGDGFASIPVRLHALIPPSCVLILQDQKNSLMRSL
jgi:hypothetical protein